MRQGMRVKPFVVVMALAAILVLCSILLVGLAPARSGTRSWESEPRVVERVRGLSLEELERSAGFEVLIPTYLPPNLDSAPSFSYVPELGEAELSYYPPRYSSSGSLVLRIAEELDPSELSCPPCPRDNVYLEKTTVSGKPVFIERSPPENFGYFVAAYFRVNDVRVTVSINREARDHPGLPSIDELEAEALRVAESIIH